MPTHRDSSSHSAQVFEKRQLRAYKFKKIVRPLIAHWKAIGSAALILIFVFLGAGYAIRLPQVHVMQHLAFYVEDGNTFDGSIASVGILGIKQIAIPNAISVYDYAKVHDIAAAIVSGAEGHGTDILLLSATPRLLTNDGVGKSALTVSSDGATIAYAQIDDASSHVLFTDQLSAWRIKTIALGTGEVVDRGIGYCPQFFFWSGEQYLLYTSPSGVTVMNLADGIPHTTPVTRGTTTRDAASITNDGRALLVQDTVLDQTILLTVQDVTPTLRLTSNGSTGVALDSVVSDEDAFFGLQRTESGGTIWKITPSHPNAPEQIYELPQGLHATRVIPQ